MLMPRVIPVLLARNDGLVKTIKFRNPVYVGDPINVVRIFNEKEVDELVLLDISARFDSGPNFRLVEAVASECFMPLAYGGAVRSLQDAKGLFALGVEKVVVRTAAAQDLDVVTRIAEDSGSQSVAVCLDLKRARLGGLHLHAPGTPKDRDPAWLRFATAATARGAGEVILNFVDRDGTMSGMDLAAISKAAVGITTPLLCVGGVGSLDHIRQGLAAGATAVGAGSFFVFHGPRRAVLVSYPDAEQLRGLGMVERA